MYLAGGSNIYGILEPKNSVQSEANQASLVRGDGHLHHVLRAMCHQAGERGDGEGDGAEVSLALLIHLDQQVKRIGHG